MYKTFSSSLSTGHSCKYPGCRTVLVLDGNMKNHRDVCMARDAGFIEFDGLEGRLKTGCQATPAHKSRYCTSHSPQAVNLDIKVPEDEEASQLEGLVGPVVRSQQQHSEPGDPVVEVLLAKRSTRKETYYQVRLDYNLAVLIIGTL